MRDVPAEVKQWHKVVKVISQALGPIFCMIEGLIHHLL